MTAKLPLITFLSGPAAAQHSLAVALGAADPELMPCSFLTPILAACRATFFEEDPSATIEPTTTLPLADCQAGVFVAAYERMLRDQFGIDIIGQLMVRALDENGDYFDRFVLTDYSHLADLRAVTKRFGPESCLMVGLNGSAENYPEFRFISFPDDQSATPKDRFTALLSYL
jgi:hypothetical protein